MTRSIIKTTPISVGTYSATTSSQVERSRSTPYCIRARLVRAKRSVATAIKRHAVDVASQSHLFQARTKRSTSMIVRYSSSTRVATEACDDRLTRIRGTRLRLAKIRIHREGERGRPIEETPCHSTTYAALNRHRQIL
jgi:hypothetical protein